MRLQWCIKLQGRVSWASLDGHKKQGAPMEWHAMILAFYCDIDQYVEPGHRVLTINIIHAVPLFGLVMELISQCNFGILKNS